MSPLLLLLLLGVHSQSPAEKEHNFKLAACMNLLRFQIKIEEESLNTFVSQSNFDQREVMTKVMGEVLAKCLRSLPLESAQDIIQFREDAMPSAEYLAYVPLPDTPILTEQALELTDEEYSILSEIQEKTKKVEEARSRGEVPVTDPSTEPAIGTSLGLVYVLVVFLAFAAIVVYGIKRLNDREAGKKKKSKKSS